MFASILSNLTTVRDSEKERYRKLLSHICDKVHVIAIRNDISSPNRFHQQHQQQQQRQQSQTQQRESQNNSGEPEQPQQQQTENITLPDSNDEDRQQRQFSSASPTASATTTTTTSRRQRTNTLIRERLQTRLREQDENEYDFIDPEEVVQQEQIERTRTNSFENNENEQQGDAQTPSEEAAADTPASRDENENNNNTTVTATATNDFEEDPELKARRFEVKGYLVFVDNKNITLLDICPPGSKEFDDRAQCLLPEHQELVRAIPVCSTIKIESIVSITVAKETEEEKSKKKKEMLKAAKRRRAHQDKNQSDDTSTSLQELQLSIPVQRRQALDRMLKTDLSGDVLCQALTLRFVWERVCVENPPPPSSTEMSVVHNSKNDTTSSTTRTRTRRRSSTALVAADHQNSNNNNSTAPDQQRENNNTNSTTNRNNRHHGTNNNEDDDEDEYTETTDTDETDHDTDEEDTTDDDEEDDSALDLDTDDEEIAEWLGIRRELEASQRRRRRREQRRRRRRREERRINNGNGNDDDDQQREGRVNLNSLARPGSPRRTRTNNNNNNSNRTNIVNSRNLADCEIMNRVVSSGGGSSSASSASPTDPQQQPNYDRIIQQKFQALQQFVGEQLVIMKLTDFDSEAEATFKVLEHAGRKSQSDFGFQLCIAQAKHLRRLNELVLEGRTANVGDALRSLFGRFGGASSAATATNFFDLDDDDLLREMLRNRFRRRNRLDGDSDDDENGFARFARTLRGGASALTSGPWMSLARIRFGFWVFMMLAFAVIASLIFWKAIGNFTQTDEAASRFLVDLSVLLLMPAASCAILSVAIFQAVVAVLTRAVRNLPLFEKLKLLRFLVTLSTIITLITVGLKWRSSEEPQGLDGVINTIATKSNSSMCNFQVEYNCSGSSEVCDPESFWFGNTSFECPVGCNYQETIFAGTEGNTSLWWSPTRSCDQFVRELVKQELIFLVGTVGSLFLINIIWGIIEATCFGIFNGRE